MGIFSWYHGDAFNAVSPDCKGLKFRRSNPWVRRWHWAGYRGFWPIQPCWKWFRETQKERKGKFWWNTTAVCVLWEHQKPIQRDSSWTPQINMNLGHGLREVWQETIVFTILYMKVSASFTNSMNCPMVGQPWMVERKCRVSKIGHL